MTDNVKPFPGSTEEVENPLQVAPRRIGAYCAHETIILDEHMRSVSCTKCHAALDPFDYLLRNATTIQRAWAAYRHQSTLANEAAERVSELKRQEANLRAVVKRLQGKGGTIVNVRGKEGS